LKAVESLLKEPTPPAKPKHEKASKKQYKQLIFKIMEANNIQLFSYENKEVRTFEKDGLIWFVLNDVSGITKHSAIKNTKKNLRPYEVGEALISDLTGRKQLMTVVSESGLYRLILKSRLPEAERFSDYVCCEILPTIRKTGGYNTNTKQLQEIAQDKQEIETLTDTKNRINKRLRFLKMRVDENETAIFAPYRANKTTALQPENESSQYSLF
jgi:prophage antirepressor-like protein